MPARLPEVHRLSPWPRSATLAAMRLRHSQHLAFFHRREEVYCRHGLTGELTAMSDDVRQLIVAFGEGPGVEPAEVLASAHLSDPDQGASFVETLTRLSILVPEGADERARIRSMVPVIGRWVAWLDDGRVQVVQGRNLQVAPEIRVLEPFEARVFRAIDGERDVAALAAALDGRPAGRAPRPGTLQRVQESLRDFCHPDRQWVALSPARLSYFRRGMPRPPWLDSTMPYAALADDAAPTDPFVTSDGGIDMRDWHREEIVDAVAQFEDRETTLAHLFRHPPPALGGVPFGAALLRGLRARQLWPGVPRAVLEVGAGSGQLAAALLQAHGDAVQAESWTIVEISPALVAAQRALLGPIATALGVQLAVHEADVESADWAPGSVDVVIANEMAGDLRADRLEVSDGPDGAAPARCGSPQAAAAIARYELDLSGAPDGSWLNTGAIGLVERAAAALRPGGLLWLSEFGHRDAWPVESTHLDHPEVSIHFGQLQRVAERCGLQAQIVDVADVIGLQEGHEALRTTATFFRNLRALLAAHGVVIDKRAWLRPALEDVLGPALPIGRLRNLHFGPIGERVMGLQPREFLALVARKPESVSALPATARSRAKRARTLSEDSAGRPR